MPLSKVSSAAALAGNKDLSCLRCRKKKAKCSKTRPTCTRCARSNQPCEYPDAPPNLSDLSQKVLGLYDTLRELEDKFMLQYASTLQQGDNANVGSAIAKSAAETADGDNRKRHNSAGPIPTAHDDLSMSDSSSLQHVKKQKRQGSPPASQRHPRVDETAQPGSWSMSLTSEGLSLHAVARNIVEFTMFAKDFTQQLRYNNPTGIPVLEWYDDEEEEEEEDDEDPLDEDEYLVTVPSYPIASLLGPSVQTKKTSMSTNTTITATTTMIADDTLHPTLDACIGEMLNDLRPVYEAIESDKYPVHQLHAAMLLKHLHSAAPFLHQSDDQNTRFCILTAYAASSTLLVPLQGTHKSNLPSVTDCVHYAIQLLKDMTLQPPLQSNRVIVVGATLLGWITHSPELIHLAVRVLCGCSEWDSRDESWQQLAALLLYVEAVICIFSKKDNDNEHQTWRTMSGDAKDWLLRAAGRLCTRQSIVSATLGLEAQLGCFLKQVYMLFYEPQRAGIGERKIDVDDVLNLVRDIEGWEQRLPGFAQWRAADEEKRDGEDNKRQALLRMHTHMVHNSVKILLFRPFSTTMRAGRGIDTDGVDDNDELQTYTRTTFLDLSLVSTDRLVDCLGYFDEEDDGGSNAWSQAARCLARDVVDRFRLAFPCDEELLKSLENTEKRLLCGGSSGKKKS